MFFPIFQAPTVPLNIPLLCFFIGFLSNKPFWKDSKMFVNLVRNIESGAVGGGGGGGGERWECIMQER